MYRGELVRAALQEYMTKVSIDWKRFDLRGQIHVDKNLLETAEVYYCLNIVASAPRFHRRSLRRSSSSSTAMIMTDVVLT